MSDTTARINNEGLTIHIPDIGEALRAMSLTDKQWVMAYMACADDLFDKVVQLMADGFCTPNEDDHGDHVGFTDDECYAVDAGIHGDADYKSHCRACITEYLEEAVQPDPAVVVGGDVG